MSEADSANAKERYDRRGGAIGVTYVVSHPIQYQAPLLRRLSSRPEIDLRVLFLRDLGEKGAYDEGFGREVAWDIDVRSGYDWEVLPGWMHTYKTSALRPISYGLRSTVLNSSNSILWVHGHAHHANLRAMALARRRGLPILYRAETTCQMRGRAGLKRRMGEKVNRSIVNHVSGFLAIGTRNWEYYHLRLGVESDRLYWVPYVVDNEFFRSRAEASAPDRERLREALRLAPERPIILFASKLQSRKRPGDLLEAYRQLSVDGMSEPHPYLLFVGDGEEAPALLEHARVLGWDSVRFLGFRNQTELPALYDLCDVFVLPSVQEPWGLVVNEVMNAGKPVIVSDQVGCAADLVADGENGYVVEAGDSEALSQRLQTLTESPGLAARMGEAGLRRISGWNLDLAVDGFVRAAERVAQDQGRAR